MELGARSKQVLFHVRGRFVRARAIWDIENSWKLGEVLNREKLICIKFIPEPVLSQFSIASYSSMAVIPR